MHYSRKRFVGGAQSFLCLFNASQLNMAMMGMPEMKFKQIFEIGFRQMKAFGTRSGCEGSLRKLSFVYISVDKFLILLYQQFIVQFADNELPFVETSRVIQQPGDVPHQNRLFIGICIVTKFFTNIIDARGEYSSLFEGYMQRFLVCIREKRVLLDVFFLCFSLEPIGAERYQPQARCGSFHAHCIGPIADECSIAVIAMLSAVLYIGISKGVCKYQAMVARPTQVRKDRTRMGVGIHIKVEKCLFVHG